MTNHMRNCPICGGEGRKLTGHPNDPEPRDEGPCDYCEGKAQLRITTWIDDCAPPSDRWCACVGEYDLGVQVATGSTEEAAITDMMENY
jgi:hypothetical protein